MRIGGGLGPRHADIAAAECEVRVCRRVNASGARSKLRDPRVIPVPAELVRRCADFLAEEYGDLDSDYVFVNLRAEPVGQAGHLRRCLRSYARAAPPYRHRLQPRWFRRTMATRRSLGVWLCKKIGASLGSLATRAHPFSDLGCHHAASRR